jgi:hypothetical protein
MRGAPSWRVMHRKKAGKKISDRSTSREAIEIPGRAFAYGEIDAPAALAPKPSASQSAKSSEYAH